MVLPLLVPALITLNPQGSPKEELKEAGKEIGHAAKKGGKAIGEVAKKGGKAIGKGAKEAAKSIKEAVDGK